MCCVSLLKVSIAAVLERRSEDVSSLHQFLSLIRCRFVLISLFRRPDEPEDQRPNGLLSLYIRPGSLAHLSVSDDAKERKTDEGTSKVPRRRVSERES